MTCLKTYSFKVTEPRFKPSVVFWLKLCYGVSSLSEAELPARLFSMRTIARAPHLILGNPLQARLNCQAHSPASNLS